MGLFRAVGRGVKGMVNVPKWVGAKKIAGDASYISTLAKSVFSVKKAKREESFEDALVRLNLTEESIKQRYVEFKRLFYIYTCSSIGLVVYTIYLYIHAYWLQAFLMTAVSGISLTLVFRYHFWMFQVKQRKLGCNVREWFSVGILGKKS